MTLAAQLRPRVGRFQARAVHPTHRGIGWATAVVLLTATVAITVLVWRTGVDGSPTGLVHLYYLPLAYVGVRFGRLAAAGAGLVAGLAAGPFMPVGPETVPMPGTGGQAVGEWAVRLGSLVVVAVGVAWLARQQPRPVEALLREAVLARSLKAAVASARIAAHFQPIVDLADGRVVGTEALARWTDRAGRAVPPDVFIPVAERSGVVMALGRHVLRLAVGQAEQWQAGGRPLFVAVNVSAAQLGDPRFVADLTETLRTSSLAPQELCLEITETAIIVDQDAALATVRAAHDLGVRIALDDFGTGLSSLAYLAKFPIDIVKIDKTFVDAVDADPKANALVLAIIEMARALEAVTIAEGIERPEQLTALRLLGCQLGQGYHLGRPVAAPSVDLGDRAVARLALPARPPAGPSAVPREARTR